MEISFIPRFILRRISASDIQRINWNILISTSLILITLMLVNGSAFDALPHFCLFRKLTGFPCPACGITRSLFSVSELRISESLSHNPNGVIIFSALLLQIPMRIMALTNEKYFPVIQKISRVMTRLIIVTLLLYWIYQLINN